jgi:hypothetical protein
VLLKVKQFLLHDDYPEKKGKIVKIDKSFQTGMGGILVKFSRYFIKITITNL